MNIRYKFAIISFSIVFCSFVASAEPATAQTTAKPPAPTTNTGGQALEIAPPVLTLKGDPGQTIKAQISLRDISSSPLIVSAQINDFIAAGEDGTPKILMEDDGDNPYSIKGWVNPLATMRLVPKEIKNLPITIKIPANASPGGHYGVVRFTATPPELEGTGVSLSASLGALVFITVNGPVNESMGIESFTIEKDGSTGTIFESTPLTFTQRIKNDGNIHDQPAGQVVITDMFGNKVAAVNVNLPPRNILPGSVRKFDQPLDSSVLGTKKLFGRYTADLKLTYGADKKEMTETITFWVVPYRLIGAAVVVLVGGAFGTRTFFKYHNQRVINKATKSKRK